MNLARRFTVMIIPEGDARVRRLRFSRRTLAAGMAFGLILCSLLSYLFYAYQATAVDLSELRRLRHENGQQRLELQRLTASVGELRQELVFVAETEARIRQLAELDGLSHTIPVAIGGIPETVSGASADLVQQRIDHLQLAIDLRRQSQEEVRNLLNDQVSLGRATPGGWPTKGWLTSYFGMRTLPETKIRRIHEGLDIAASTGTPVVATADGVVARVEYSPSYGKTVVLDHGYGYRTLFAHNSRILVKSGQRVMRGDRIAEVGNTGRSTGPHLHYEVLLNGVPIDPRRSL